MGFCRATLVGTAVHYLIYGISNFKKKRKLVHNSEEFKITGFATEKCRGLSIIMVKLRSGDQIPDFEGLAC